MLVVLYDKLRGAYMVAARIPDHGLLLAMLDMSNVQMIFPIVLWIRSMIALE